MITCGDIKFEAPTRMGALPYLEFSYPVKVTAFSFRDGNLLLVAVDEAETTHALVL